MPKFIDLVNKGSLTFADVKKLMACIEDTAKKEGYDPFITALTLDFEYPTIFHTYCSFRRGNSTSAIEVIDGESLIRLSEKGKVTETLEKQYETAKIASSSMAVNVTGARPGETLLGIVKCTKNAKIIANSIINPSKVELEKIRMFPDLWRLVLERLESFAFFRNMSLIERAIWLYTHEKPGDFDIAENRANITILEIGSSKLTELDSETITELLSKESIPAMTVRESFPKKPGSKARRNTLIFFLYYWKLELPFDNEKFPKCPVYDFEKSKMVDGSSVEKALIFTLSGKKVGVSLPAQDKIVDYTEIIKKRYGKDMELVSRCCKNFTAAGYKSLLQKIIRYRPLKVEGYDSKFVLASVFTILMTHPGSFVPDIQRFVTGQESSMKRLLITILEDSFCEDHDILEKLAWLAFLSQRNALGKVGLKIYNWCLDICEMALEETRTFKYSNKEGESIEAFKLGTKHLENTSALLDDIRSFASDIHMTRSIVKNKGVEMSNMTLDKRPKDMGIFHCIDQHWAPEIAYVLPMDLLEKYRSTTKPFYDLFKELFRKVSGENSRRQRRYTQEDLEFRNYIIEGQKFVLKVRRDDPEHFAVDETKKIYRLNVELSSSWIAGLVGVIDVTGTPPAMVTLRPEDPYQMVAMRRPARGVKDSILPDSRVEDAIEKAKKKLAQGVPLKGCVPPIKDISSYTLILQKDTEEYLFKKGSDLLHWDDLSKRSYKIPVFSGSLEHTFKDFHDPSTAGIFLDAFNLLKARLKEYSEACVRRLLSYISSYSSEFEIAKLSKDGGGTAQTVLLEDAGACQLALYICLYFPYAIKNIGITKFKIIFAPMFWKVRDTIREYLNGSQNLPEKSEWKKVKDNSGRELRSYQKECLDDMINKKTKGHFLWLTVGLGKTLIVLSYLKYLIDNSRAPKYVLYTLPSSAITSIIKEIEYFGFKINFMIPIKSWKNKNKEQQNLVKSNDELLPYHINILEHDHMRLIQDELTLKAPDSLIIIDEVHKALNDTKRTNTALDASRLSFDFIALTGTPVIDSNVYKLIWWLEQIVDFEVNEKNFWVAANAMVSKKINTGIEVDRDEIESVMTKEERGSYRALIPEAMGGTSKRSTLADIQKAFELSYKVCDREIISQTRKFVADGFKVMLVARNKKHQNELAKKINDLKVLIMEESVFITDETVSSGSTPDYDVVVVPLNKSAGYTLTRMNVMITGVYPSNNAVREQLEGRINRVSQHSKKIYYRTIYGGILSYVLQKHKDAASISAVLASIAKEVNIEE